VSFLAPGHIEDWIGHPVSIGVARARLGRCRIARDLVAIFDNTPTGQSAWLALPDACLCAPMFITDFDDGLSIFAASDGTSLA
jgi:hypothetical protein